MGGVAVIVDCCLYAYESDLLELRLHELSDVVDLFVVVGALETFTGKAKPSFLHLDDRRYAPFRGRIYRVVLGWLDGDTAWEREAYQRNAIAGVLERLRLAPDDLILISDVDEIPRAEAVRDVADLPDLRHSTAAFDQTVYFYHPQCRNTVRWYGTRAVRYGRMEAPQAYRATEWLRPDDVVIPEAGWHFSYFMDTDAIRRKVASYSHTEVNRPEYLTEQNLRAAMRDCRSFVSGDGQTMERVVPHDLPDYMIRNPAKYGLETAMVTA